MITNREALATSPARELALRLAEAGLAAIETGPAMRQAVRLIEGKLTVEVETAGVKAEKKSWPLAPAGRLLVVAIGKCAFDAALALEEILGDRLSDGVAVDVRETATCPTRKIRCFQGDHPFPTERNVSATDEIFNLLRDLTEADTVIFAISGGGSTLLCSPHNFLCADERQILERLFQTGATIAEINLLRQHLSRARGGGLAAAAYPAQVISLIFSDVPGDRLEFVASGPTIRSTGTVAEAAAVAERYRLTAAGFRPDFLSETPKDEKFFRRVSNLLLVSNQTALQAMRRAASEAGYLAEVASADLNGEAATVGRRLAAELAALPSRSARFWGGETVVTLGGVSNESQGGRNQELALAALEIIDESVLLLPLASDGWDNSPAAGAVCDIITKRRSAERGLAPTEFLARHDAYHFFEQTGDLILTGRTGANVSDLIIGLKN